MQATIVCPGCQKQLALPALPAGQTVQCPGCQRVFEPNSREPSAPPPRPLPRDEVEDETADRAPFELTRGRAPAHPRGEWFAVLTMVLLGANVLVYAAWGYCFFEEAQRRAQFGLFGGGVAFRQHFRFTRHVEEAAEIAPWPAVVACFIWAFVAALNARSLNNVGMLAPGALALGFLCCLPGAIVFYIVLQELWRTSDPVATGTPNSWRSVPPSWWIRAWGLLCLSVPLLIWLSFKLDDVREGGVMSSQVAVVSNLAVALGCVMLIGIIFAIVRRQRRRYLRLDEDAV
jgi:hypothetical protein